MSTPTKPSVDPVAPRQSKSMATASISDMGLLFPVEVAGLLRVSRVSIYRMAAKGLLPVYRICRKMLFKRQDVLDYLERSKTDPYGSPKD